MKTKIPYMLHNVREAKHSSREMYSLKKKPPRNAQELEASTLYIIATFKL